MTALTWARVSAAILAAILFTASVALADTRVVVVSGNPAPDGNGVFAGASNAALSTPALNASGHAAFTALLVGTTPTTDSGIFVGDGFTLTQIAREGAPAPGGGTFGFLATGLGLPFLFSPGINGAGQVVFEANVLVGGVGHQGIFRSSGPPATLVEIARAGAPAPDGDGTFFILGIPALNDAGQVAFTSTMSATAGFGIFRGDGATITQIGRSGQAVPEGAGTFTSFSGPNAPGINDHGAVAFGDFLGQGTGVAAGGAVLLSDGALRLIARDGRAAPGAPGTFALNGPLLGPVVVNEAGQVAFTFKGTGVSGNFTGVYLTQGTTLTEVIRTGATAPGSTQTLGAVFAVGLNDAGQVAFVGGLVPSTRGIFRTNAPAAGARPIAFQFQATPDGRGTFGFLGGTPEGYAVALNNEGQVAFYSPVSGSTSAAGIFFHDDARGLQQVARLGDPLLGSTITDLRFRGAQLGDGSQAFTGREYTGLNDAGQVAFWFALADGRRGIALWTPPAVVADPLADFVTGFYESLLGRTPPAGEVAPWVAFLRANCSPDGIRLFAGGFLHSEEYLARPTTVAERVTVLYDLFLGRTPDAPGQAGWASAFVEAFNSLLPGFVGSAEFQFLLTTTAPEALVVRLYQEVLGRQPSADEVQAWAGFLRVTGDYSAFARGFLDSQEYLARPLSLAQHVTILYATFLGRAPDAPGRDGWVHFLDAQFQPIYNGFIDSAEFQGQLSLCR